MVRENVNDVILDALDALGKVLKGDFWIDYPHHTTALAKKKCPHGLNYSSPIKTHNQGMLVYAEGALSSPLVPTGGVLCPTL